MIDLRKRSLRPRKRRRITRFQADTSSSSSDHPQLRAPSFEFNPSLPLLNPPATLNDDVLPNLHARTHRTTDESDDEDYEDTLEGDAAEAIDFDVDIEGEVDPRKGVVSDWDILTEKFIVEAEELGEFHDSLLHTP